MALDVSRSIRDKQAKVFFPSIFIEQDPQIPSRQDLRKVKVGSISFLIFTMASKIIGPHSFKFTLKSCNFGFVCGSSGFF